MNVLQPEVLRALAERCARETGRRLYAAAREVVALGDFVHEIPREELEAAYSAGVLELDRVATATLLREATS